MPSTPPVDQSVVAEPATPVWMKRVPMVTGVLAGLAGFLTVKSANLSDQAIYHSTQAVLHQSRASDDWSEYQADSIKRHIDQVALSTTTIDPAVKATLTAEAKSMKDDRQQRKSTDAHSEEQMRDDELNNGAQRLATKDLLDYAGVAAQLGIALASVAALTRRQTWFNIGVVVGLIALMVTAYALLVPMLTTLLHHGK